MAFFGETGKPDVSKIISAWDDAERAIKQAEIINDQVVIPAIAELRYAGRRLAEAWEKQQKGDEDAARALFDDAYFFCCRAQHDAIDAGTAKIARDYAICVKGIGASEKSCIFPEHSEFHNLLRDIKKNIVKSREDRENRDKIYELIRVSDFPKIVKFYQKFEDCQPQLEELARKARRAWLKPLFWGFILTQSANVLWHIFVD